MLHHHHHPMPSSAQNTVQFPCLYSVYISHFRSTSPSPPVTPSTSPHVIKSTSSSSWLFGAIEICAPGLQPSFQPQRHIWPLPSLLVLFCSGYAMVSHILLSVSLPSSQTYNVITFIYIFSVEIFVIVTSPRRIRFTRSCFAVPPAATT